MQNAESIIWKPRGGGGKKQGIQQLFSVFYAVYTGKRVFTYNFGPRTWHKLANNI